MNKNESYEKLLTLIKQAQGDRSLNQFALNCNVNAGHLSRVLNGKFVNPPTPDFLKKISQHAYNEVTYDNLMEAAGYTVNDIKTELEIPKDYLDKYKVTSRDKKQYFESMKQSTAAFFMNDEFDEEDKKELLDTMTEIFWQAKAMNKRKPKDE
jgi:transcriptional regulator with XRE-family HTH domain